MAEHTDPLRQNDAVDPILQPVVLAANVELAKGVLSDFGRLHYHLIEQGVVTAGRGRHRCRINGIGGSAGLRLDMRAALVQVLGGHDDGGQSQRVGSGRSG